jgi:hypothetical protein
MKPIRFSKHASGYTASRGFGGRETMRRVELQGIEPATAPLALQEKPPKKYGT